MKKLKISKGEYGSLKKATEQEGLTLTLISRNILPS